MCVQLSHHKAHHQIKKVILNSYAHIPTLTSLRSHPTYLPTFTSLRSHPTYLPTLTSLRSHPTYLPTLTSLRSPPHVHILLTSLRSPPYAHILLTTLCSHPYAHLPTLTSYFQAKHLLKHNRTAVTQCVSLFSSSRDSEYHNGCDEHVL